MKCHRCQTSLPPGARFCFNCGAPQPEAPKREAKPPPKPMVDLDGDIEKQLIELFFQALRLRVEEEHREEQFQAYSERLYESGFRDTVYRKASHLAEELRALQKKSAATPREANRRIVESFEEQLDYFIIHHCQDINDTPLPEAILRWQGMGREDADLFQLSLDYLDFAGEPDEAVYTDFLKMPVDKLKNAGRFFLFPEKEERIFFICDQSLLGSCREGFALTSRALYWKAQLQTARKAPYATLESVRRERDWLLVNSHFFNANPSLNLKMMKLLKKLNRLFR
ncbi:MAG: zinc ribbon domain-containing protein [Phaeodactylibacter sp.]|nr:zinc ribbon domain-containing protein [Phaeodactylibacter sp.]